MNPPIEQLTVQNYDLQFGTNVLGHYLFSKPLIPLMETTTAPLPAMQPVCLVKLASSVHLLNHFTSKELINYDTLQLGEWKPATGRKHLGRKTEQESSLLSRSGTRDDLYRDY
jgi:NAD(P)-dependent dehydrogenase (short-subunit alcohol dehydrogenase family)